MNEVSWLYFSKLTTNVFFKVVSKRYEQGDMIFTSNITNDFKKYFHYYDLIL
ncbi:ATP-binding protein [Peribacillus asahii]|uniref:ATP-binding protein n=1 Tax=Peribacillus asahii TaxID=228899 RepID=UPI00381691B4